MRDYSYFFCFAWKSRINEIPGSESVQYLYDFQLLSVTSQRSEKPLLSKMEVFDTSQKVDRNSDQRLFYDVNEVPPWPSTILMGFQV